MLNVFDRMENIVWKGEYADVQNFSFLTIF